jgi:hypothetical protein
VGVVMLGALVFAGSKARTASRYDRATVHT